MKRDVIMTPTTFQESSFLSCEKDCETILRKLFVNSYPYSEKLKRLLTINTKDCLDNYDSEIYKNRIKEMSLPKLIENGYILPTPKVIMREHEEVKSYLILSFDNFSPTSNPKYRDCTVHIDILCHTDYWDLGGFRMRPLKIAGYIDGMLNESKLSGIGTLQFASCKELLLDETLAGYTLMYVATHGSDDRLN